MKLPIFLIEFLQKFVTDTMASRDPDFYIGGKEDPYLLRWWVIPRNKWFNIYLHRILKSDRDEALHDHPWINCSILVFGEYLEHTIAAGGCEHIAPLRAGEIRFRRPTAAHRLVVDESAIASDVITIFITGPVWRHWGFHCPRGWRHWKDFVGFRDEQSNVVGRGCGEMDIPSLPGGRIRLFAPLNRSSDKRPS